MCGLLLLLFLRHLGTTVVDLHGHLLETLLASGVVRVDFQSLLVGFHCLVVFLECHFDVSLSGPRLGVFGVEFQGLFDLHLGTVEIHDFGQSRREIVANGRVIRCALDGFLVFLDGLRKFLFPEKVVPALFGFLRLALVLVIQFVLFLLFQFQGLEETLGVFAVRFQLRRLAHFDGIGKIALLLIGPCRAGQCLRSVLKGSKIFLSDFHRLVALLDAVVVFFHSKVDRGLVQQKCHGGGINGNGFVVCGQGLLKLFGLVEGVSFLLLHACFSLGFFLFAFFRRELGPVFLFLHW
mmetsp:Transcript_22159/g.61667  ORF Transcript_22159/g.61667 Transcript_22159/m.61667 type:complete len:294 (-) Transcript_22159:1280-2161(-)